MKILEFIKSLFSDKSSSTSNVSNSPPIVVNDPFDAIPDPKDVFRNILGMHDINRDDDISKNLKNILVEIENMGDRFRKLGESDGPYQLDSDFVNVIANNVADRTRNYIETIFMGLKNSLEAISPVKERQFEDAENDVNQTKEYINDLLKDKKFKPDNYSYWAWFYLIFGLALLISDIILSKKGIQHAFRISEGNSIEAWILSGGITSCAIYIKIYYDEFILPALERCITIFKKNNMKGVEPNDSKIWLYSIWSLRFIIKTGLLIFTMFSLYYLADLRFDFVLLENDNAESLNLKSSRISFIMISLLFPLIGGVCMAISIKKFQYLGLWGRSKKANEKAINSHAIIQNEYNQYLQDYNNCVSYLNRFTTDEFINKLKEFFFNCYLHGREYSFREHNNKRNIVQKAKEIRRIYPDRIIRN